MAEATGMNIGVLLYWIKKGEIKPDFQKRISGQTLKFFKGSRIEEIKAFHAAKKSIRYRKKVPFEVQIERHRATSRRLAAYYWKTSSRRRLVHRLRCRIWKALTRNAGKPSPMTENLVGCTIPELRRHFESSFKDGMNWENYGIGGWVIDHIKPCILFDLANEKERLECFRFSNLRPLWDLENRKKGPRPVDCHALLNAGA